MILRKAVLLLVCLLALFPLYWLAIGSFKDTPGLFSVPPQFIPRRVTLANYAELTSNSLFVRWVFNSVVLSAGSVVLSVVLCMAAGYGLAVGKLPKWLFVILMLGLMIPRQSLTVPLFIQTRKLGLIDTLPGVLLPLLYCPVGIYFAKNWLASMSTGYLDEARIAGAGPWQMLTQVLLPLSAPVVGVVALIQGTVAFTDFLWQSLVLQSDTNWTLQVGLIAEAQRTGWDRRANVQGMRLAAAMILFVPLIVLGVLSQRKFVDNVSRGIAE